MTRRGRRSRRAQIRRFISRVLSKEAHRDRVKSESVNTLLDMQVATAVQKRFGFVDWRLVQDIDKGEILSDPRGEGSLQQVI